MNGDKEFISENGGDPVSTAINALPRVSAPSGFENNVLREIRSRSQETRPAGMTWLKVAVPTAVLALLAAFFGFSSISTNEIPKIAVVDEPKSQNGTSPENGSGRELTATRDLDANNKAIVNGEKESVARRSTNENVATLTDRPSKNGNDGSTDFAGNSASRPVLPRGFDPESKPLTNAPGISQTTTVRLVDIVQILGIKANLRNNEFVAESVAANSQAMRADVRVGDIVEAVNEVAMSSTATLTGRVEIRSIRVRRDGRSIILRL